MTFSLFSSFVFRYLISIKVKTGTHFDVEAFFEKIIDAVCHSVSFRINHTRIIVTSGYTIGTLNIVGFGYRIGANMYFIG